MSNKNSPFKVIGDLASSFINIYQGVKGSKARKAEQQEANKELARRKVDLEGTDISNPYANMENVFEDLTVNQQQAQFEAQQGQQQRANIMQNMQGAAGSSGVAGLAQAMANQGQMATQRASASIGQQEAANQRMAAQGASSIQSMERQGKALEQSRRLDMNETLLGMSQQRKIAADEARQRARDQIAKGVGQGLNAVTSIATGMPMKGKKSSPAKQKKTYPKSYTKEDVKFLKEQREDVVRYEDLDEEGKAIWNANQAKIKAKNKTLEEMIEKGFDMRKKSPDKIKGGVSGFKMKGPLFFSKSIKKY